MVLVFQRRGRRRQAQRVAIVGILYLRQLANYGRLGDAETEAESRQGIRLAQRAGHDDIASASQAQGVRLCEVDVGLIDHQRSLNFFREAFEVGDRDDRAGRRIWVGNVRQMSFPRRPRPRQAPLGGERDRLETCSLQCRQRVIE